MRFVLPRPGSTYRQSDMNQLVAQIEDALSKCLVVGETINISTTSPIRFRSPDGTYWTVSVDNSGHPNLTSP